VIGAETSPDVAASVRAALLPHPLVRSVEFVGSRAAGTPVPLSDWDFVIETDDFENLAADLPALVAALDPLAEQWDPLNKTWCYMVMLAGPMKVDLIFRIPHRDEPPWTVTAETLPGIDRHFWDWILWLASKHQAGKHRVVRTELHEMSRHLLRPLGVSRVPDSIADAIQRYRIARDEWAARSGAAVPGRLEREVMPAVLSAVRPEQQEAHSPGDDC
jgi:hypothetical protein